MARGKKKESALTPEEKLAQALVPVEEQPYKVPDNWCWTRTGSIAEVASGGTPSSSVAEYYEGGTIPWISPADLSGYNDIYISSGAKNITKLGLEKSSARLLPADTVCLSSRAPIGYVAIAQNPLCTNQGFKNFMPSTCYLPKYLYWYLKGNKELLESYASGTTFLELSGSKAAVVEIPLAPLAEQHRIVDRIESLFAKLDEAKEKAQSALDSFETRKAAILHKAFTGELTAKWRAEHGVHFAPNNYSLIEVFNFIDYRGMTPDKTDSGIPLITAKNIKKGYIDYRISEYISPETYLQRLGRGIARRNDLLITTEAPLGNVALADQDTYSTAQRVIVLQLREEYRDKVNNKYVMHYMLDESFQTKLQDQKTGSTVAGIKAAKLKLIPIVLPCVDEQLEVVRILDSLFAKEQQAKEAAEAVLEKIDLLKKSILARAFRGELGTNDPTEESALELLKAVL